MIYIKKMGTLKKKSASSVGFLLNIEEVKQETFKRPKTIYSELLFYFIC